MIEVLNLSPDVAAFRASGKVTKMDYEEIIMPVVENLAEKMGKINFLLVLDTDIGSFSAGAILDDVWLGLKEFTQWHKMAIVSDQEGLRKFTDIFSALSPGELKGFSKAEYETAVNWVSS